MNATSANDRTHKYRAYEIRLGGHLDIQRWTEWFEDATITLAESGDTVLTSPVPDQAALYGLLRKVRDLGMPLISITPIDQDSAQGEPK